MFIFFWHKEISENVLFGFAMYISLHLKNKKVQQTITKFWQLVYRVTVRGAG
jgi:hypothetical protein